MTERCPPELLGPGDLTDRAPSDAEVVEITSGDDPWFDAAFALLWDTFGPLGELETEDEVRSFFLDDPYEPDPRGTSIRYFLLAAVADGRVVGARDGTALANPEWPGVCVVFLSHLVVAAAARGTTLAPRLRAAPLAVARRWWRERSARGAREVDDPAIWCVAELEWPSDAAGRRRARWYADAGFRLVDPEVVWWEQPPLRPGDASLPLMFAVRPPTPADEVAAADLARLLAMVRDDFATFCGPDRLCAIDPVVARAAAHPGPTVPLVALPW